MRSNEPTGPRLAALGTGSPEPADPRPNQALFLINGFLAVVTIWSPDEWRRLAGPRPGAVQALADGSRVEIRVS